MNLLTQVFLFEYMILASWVISSMGKNKYRPWRSWFIWRWRLASYFVDQNLSRISKKGTNIIWRSLRKKQFCKVSWVWLKNWACHAHFYFELWMGVAGSNFDVHPQNFGKLFIFYSWTNDITTISLYFLSKIGKFRKTYFFSLF